MSVHDQHGDQARWYGNKHRAFRVRRVIKSRGVIELVGPFGTVTQHSAEQLDRYGYKPLSRKPAYAEQGHYEGRA